MKSIILSIIIIISCAILLTWFFNNLDLHYCFCVDNTSIPSNKMLVMSCLFRFETCEMICQSVNMIEASDTQKVWYNFTKGLPVNIDLPNVNYTQ